MQGISVDGHSVDEVQFLVNLHQKEDELKKEEEKHLQLNVETHFFNYFVDLNLYLVLGA